MFLMRWKSCIRKPYVWAFVVVAVLASAIPAVSSKYESSTKLPIGLVDEDGSGLSAKLEQYMASYDGNLLIFRSDRDEALRNLAMGRLEAVYIIDNGFAESLRRGEYKGLVTMVAAPASSAAQALSETVINSTIMVWMEEKAMLEMGDFMKAHGLPFTNADSQALRARFDEMLNSGSSVTVVSHVPTPPETGGAYAALLESSAWYAAFIALFLIASAGWVLESKRKALGERMRAMGIHPISALTGSTLAVAAIAMLGWCASVAFAAKTLHAGISLSLCLLPPMLLYMAGMMGITLFISSLLGSAMQLMLIAPVYTLVQGILCGMLATIPGWAGMLVELSLALPGRWLMLGGDALLHGGNPLFLLGQAACAIVWLGIGTAAALAGTRSVRFFGGPSKSSVTCLDS
jgi:hypothetical protein